uniref:Uncharacterized protein n=1 Tax=Anguilla anguilla TaxID=7936 RepID=A0A0E9WW95_ANGAN
MLYFIWNTCQLLFKAFVSVNVVYKWFSQLLCLFCKRDNFWWFRCPLNNSYLYLSSLPYKLGQQFIKVSHLQFSHPLARGQWRLLVSQLLHCPYQ